MKYLVLIAGDESLWDRMAPAEQEAEMGAFGAFDEAVNARGKVLAGEALTPTSAATTIRHDGQRRVLHDGPFAESVEQIGAFYLVELDDFDQLVDALALLPDHYAYELRPVVDLS